MHQIWHHLRKATRLSNSVRCSGPTLRSLPSLAWLENLHREQPIKHLNLIPEPPQLSMNMTNRIRDKVQPWWSPTSTENMPDFVPEMWTALTLIIHRPRGL